jgi:general stress protein 26
MELNLENTKDFPLADELREKLLTDARECVMSWSTVDGWPMAICHIFLWHEGRIWTSTSGHKKRVKALRKRPQSCIVVSGEGNEVGGERSVAIKTRVRIHDDRATKDWFYPAIAGKENPDNPDMAKAFVGLLDSPRRVILEHEPVKFISYDGIAMRDSLIARISEAMNAGAADPS